MSNEPSFLNEEYLELEHVEKRRSFRFPTFWPRPETVLKIGRKKIPVAMLDESAGGFAVLADRRPAFKESDVAELRLRSCWYEVRVTHIRELPTSPMPFEENLDPVTRPKYRIGLERLADLGPFDHRMDWSGQTAPAVGRDSATPSLTLVVATAVVTLLALAVPINMILTSTSTGLRGGNIPQYGAGSDPSGVDSAVSARRSAIQQPAVVPRLPGQEPSPTDPLVPGGPQIRDHLGAEVMHRWKTVETREVR